MTVAAAFLVTLRLSQRTKGMNPIILSEDFWLPQWTPSSLIHKRFFEFHLKERKERPLEYVQGQTLFPETLDICWVDSMEKADFFVVDDDIQPTDVEYLEILSKAKKQCIPILTRTDVEVRLSEFSTLFRAHNYIANPPNSDPFFSPLIIYVHFYHHIRLVHGSENPVQFENVQEDDDGHKLTFDEKNIESLQREDAIEILEHEILLRDPIVRRYVDLSEEAYKEWDSKLERMFDNDPRRVVRTRWRIEDVLANYFSEAWHFLSTTTCMWRWDEEKFNRDYGTPSDLFKPAEVARAALFEFFDDNEETVEELAGVIPTDIHSTANIEYQQGEPKLNDSHFACKYQGCGKSFNRLHDLEMHEKVHLGRLVDAFSCSQCSERFPVKSALLIHQSKVHQTL
ncbi:hypothetical protein BC937DRAFT_92221 [Endogone sp. FLAS-F59071]|nr:hypothetical protein BC937DRAFT_92221 [Endogone sp. FLAS-F59071]|eukprot:RUS15621.1 hypothetical protein BC937DRAFT_92221 [Endogone sp. FLAS-F59071]